MHQRACLEIGTLRIGERCPCFVIAEVAQAHDGSLGMAHAFIDAVAKTGANAVKFQTHIADAESTPAEPWRVCFSPQDVTRYDYWRRMEFTPDQWQCLKQHAEDCGLIFLSSPFSEAAVDLLARMEIAAWKIASGEANNTALFSAIAKTGRPVLLSTGMSPLKEVDRTVEWLRQKGLQLAILQCTSLYPCPPEKIGLNLIPFLRKRYSCPTGLSDHSGTIFAGLAAAALGIDVLEVHVTLSREMFGPDVCASVTTAELTQLLQGIRYIERMASAKADKDELFKETEMLRSLFTKSIVAAANLPRGTTLRQEHLAVKKPGTGIPAERLPEVVGRQLKCNVLRNHLIQEDDLD